jgi:SepF-like predicted cell division protein (DUF552 family)
MKIFGKKEENGEDLDSPKNTMGFSGFSEDFDSEFKDFFIKKYEFTSLEQLSDIKTQLRSRKILIINVKKLLESGNCRILEFKEIIDELKVFINKQGGSIGRLGVNYLILTPNSQIRISN